MKYKYNGQWVDVNIKALDSMVIGSIIQFVGTTIPTGWLECDGSTITQSAYPELYDLIGGTLPDFRGRVLVGQDTNDTDFDTLGKTGGEKKHLLAKSELPDVRLSVYTSYDASGEDVLKFSTSGVGSMTQGSRIGLTEPLGNSIPHNILQPYAVVKHIIKAKNTTPTMASIVNTTNNSTTDAYSCNYVNKKLDTLNDYQDTTITFNNEWRIAQVVYGYGIALPIPVFNPKGITPTLNITSAEIYTSNGWVSLGTLNVDLTSKTQIVLRTSNTIGSNYNGQCILFRLNGSIKFE